MQITLGTVGPNVSIYILYALLSDEGMWYNGLLFSPIAVDYCYVV